VDQEFEPAKASQDLSVDERKIFNFQASKVVIPVSIGAFKLVISPPIPDFNTTPSAILCKTGPLSAVIA
jgi:hypothetical protein